MKIMTLAISYARERKAMDWREVSKVTFPPVHSQFLMLVVICIMRLSLVKNIR